MRLLIMLLILVVPLGQVPAHGQSIFNRVSEKLNLKGEKYLKQAEDAYDQEQYQQALELYQKYLKKSDERNAEILYRMALCGYELGSFEQGYPWIEEASSLKPDNLDYSLMMAEYLVSLRQQDAAVQTYRHILKLHPKDYLSYIRLGELLVDNGDLAGARKEWLAAIELDSTRPDAYNLMSQSYLHVEKNRLEAFYYARKSEEASGPRDKPAAARYAKQIAGDLLEDYENDYKRRNCMRTAQASFKKARFQEAYDRLNGCRTLTGLSSDYFLLFGKVCDEVGKFNDAAYAYERCLALGMESGDVCYRLGWSYLNSGNRESAEIAFKRAAGFDDTRLKAQKMLEQIRAK